MASNFFQPKVGRLKGANVTRKQANATSNPTAKTRSPQGPKTTRNHTSATSILAKKSTSNGKVLRPPKDDSWKSGIEGVDWIHSTASKASSKAKGHGGISSFTEFVRKDKPQLFANHCEQGGKCLMQYTRNGCQSDDIRYLCKGCNTKIPSPVDLFKYLLRGLISSHMDSTNTTAKQALDSLIIQWEKANKEAVRLDMYIVDELYMATLQSLTKNSNVSGMCGTPREPTLSSKSTSQDDEGETEDTQSVEESFDESSDAESDEEEGIEESSRNVEDTPSNASPLTSMDASQPKSVAGASQARDINLIQTAVKQLKDQVDTLKSENRRLVATIAVLHKSNKDLTERDEVRQADVSRLTKAVREQKVELEHFDRMGDIMEEHVQGVEDRWENRILELERSVEEATSMVAAVAQAQVESNTPLAPPSNSPTFAQVANTPQRDAAQAQSPSVLETANSGPAQRQPARAARESPLNAQNRKGPRSSHHGTRRNKPNRRQVQLRQRPAVDRGAAQRLVIGGTVRRQQSNVERHANLHEPMGVRQQQATDTPSSTSQDVTRHVYEGLSFMSYGGIKAAIRGKNFDARGLIRNMQWINRSEIEVFCAKGVSHVVKLAMEAIGARKVGSGAEPTYLRNIENDPSVVIVREKMKEERTRIMGRLSYAQGAGVREYMKSYVRNIDSLLGLGPGELLENINDKFQRSKMRRSPPMNPGDRTVMTREADNVTVVIDNVPPPVTIGDFIVTQSPMPVDGEESGERSSEQDTPEEPETSDGDQGHVPDTLSEVITQGSGLMSSLVSCVPDSIETDPETTQPQEPAVGFEEDPLAQDLLVVVSMEEEESMDVPVTQDVNVPETPLTIVPETQEDLTIVLEEDEIYIPESLTASQCQQESPTTQALGNDQRDLSPSTNVVA